MWTGECGGAGGALARQVEVCRQQGCSPGRWARGIDLGVTPLSGQDPQREGEQPSLRTIRGAERGRHLWCFKEAGPGGLRRWFRLRDEVITDFEKIVSTYQRAEVALHGPRHE